MGSKKDFEREAKDIRECLTDRTNEGVLQVFIARRSLAHKEANPNFSEQLFFEACNGLGKWG